MTGPREATVTQITDVLLDARREGRPLLSLPPELLPTGLEEVYAVQDSLAASFGEAGGWKVGAPNAEDVCRPVEKRWSAQRRMMSGGRDNIQQRRRGRSTGQSWRGSDC